MGEILFNRKAHKKLWLWLAKNPNKQKEEWPGWKDYDIWKIPNECFACEFAMSLRRTGVGLWCYYLCPFSFKRRYSGEFDAYRECLGGIYRAYEDAGDYSSRRNLKLRTKLARKIAMMPVKEGVKCL